MPTGAFRQARHDDLGGAARLEIAVAIVVTLCFFVLTIFFILNIGIISTVSALSERRGAPRGNRRWPKNLHSRGRPELPGDKFPSPHSSRASLRQYRKRSPQPGADPFAASVTESQPVHSLPFRFVRVLT